VVANGTVEEVKAQLVERYLLLDSADRGALRAELTRSGLHFRELPPFRIELNGTSAHEIVKRIETPLTVLQTHAPSLEDAYLAIVEGA
jgi:ABC-2 type transport system ATP-binding protein